MNESDNYSATWKREDAARAEIHKLEELVENWSAEATKQSERADAAEDRVKELEELLEKWALHAARESERADAAEDRLRDVIKAGNAMAKSAGYVSPPLEWTAARQQGGAK